MSNIIEVNFPKKSNYKKTRSRVFFLSHYHTGPPLCQDIGREYLKRKPNNIWGLQSYFQGRVVELDECHADDMKAMLSRWFFADDIPIKHEVIVERVALFEDDGTPRPEAVTKDDREHSQWYDRNTMWLYSRGHNS
tara:strand:+ start:89 stop:496 length:408 start_codon:yes stop_codon:yes gene_type:complete